MAIVNDFHVTMRLGSSVVLLYLIKDSMRSRGILFILANVLVLAFCKKKKKNIRKSHTRNLIIADNLSQVNLIGAKALIKTIPEYMNVPSFG